MSLASLNAELNRLTNKKTELSVYRDKIISLGKTISNIKTLEVAEKINKYYKIDDISTDKISQINATINSIGSNLLGNTSISSAISIVDRDIKVTKGKIQEENRRLAEEEARRKAEEAENQRMASNNTNKKGITTRMTLK